MRHTYLFKFYLSKTKCKRPEVNTEPTTFLTLMNNGKIFSSLDDMPKGIGFLETLHNPIYLEIILITPGIETQNNKKDDGIVELLIPTLNKIIRNKVFILQ